MPTLKFKDGKSVDFTEGSTLDIMVIIVKSFAELDAIRNEFEKENNLIGGTFGSETISNTVYTGCSVIGTAGENLRATFTTRPFTHDEQVDARLADLEDVVSNM